MIRGSGMTCHSPKRPPAVLQFYIWFRFRPHHRSRHVILHQFPKFYPNRTTFGKKMTSYRFSRWRISAILDCRGPVMGSLKSPCTTSYRSSIKTIALNCLVFEKIAFFCILATDKQTNKQTDGQHRCTKPLSLLSVRKLCHVPDRKPRPLPHIKPQAKHFTLVKFMLAAGAYSWHP